MSGMEEQHGRIAGFEHGSHGDRALFGGLVFGFKSGDQRLLSPLPGPYSSLPARASRGEGDGGGPRAATRPYRIVVGAGCRRALTFSLRRAWEISSASIVDVGVGGKVTDARQRVPT